eukprot:1036873-Rhodomonas_salina.2
MALHESRSTKLKTASISVLALHAGALLHLLIHDTAISAQFVPGTWFLVFDFGVDDQLESEHSTPRKSNIRHRNVSTSQSENILNLRHIDGLWHRVSTAAQTETLAVTRYPHCGIKCEQQCLQYSLYQKCGCLYLNTPCI